VESVPFLREAVEKQKEQFIGQLLKEGVYERKEDAEKLTLTELALLLENHVRKK